MSDLQLDHLSSDPSIRKTVIQMVNDLLDLSIATPEEYFEMTDGVELDEGLQNYLEVIDGCRNEWQNIPHTPVTLFKLIDLTGTVITCQEVSRHEYLRNVRPGTCIKL